jgi:hypothetical protein
MGLRLAEYKGKYYVYLTDWGWIFIIAHSAISILAALTYHLNSQQITWNPVFKVQN